MPSANEPHAARAAAGDESRLNEGPTILVRKLAAIDVPTYLERVVTQDNEQVFAVVERLSRGGMTDDAVSECVRDARIAATLEHPNVVRTRSITVRPEEISVTFDYIAGERLSDLWSLASGSVAALPLEIALRILVDVSTGLGALHKLRSGEGQERVKFVHGEVTGSNVLVGLDGVSVVLRAARARRHNVLPKAGIGTLAPEVLSGEAADQRADIYSLGALLWQMLSGRPLFADDDVSAILASAKQGTVAHAVVAKDAAWALPLADVAARALAPAPDKRFPTTSSMMTELRRIAGPKLATAIEVSEFVEAVAGKKIAARLSDVLTSAVIRKVASIPPPRLVREEADAIIERDSGPTNVAIPANDRESKRPTLDGAESKRPADAVTRPIEPAEIAAKQEMPSPRIEPARREPSSEPPSEPQASPPPAARPPERPRPSALTTAKPIATPRTTKVTRESKAVVPRSPVVRKAQVVPAPLLTQSALGRPGVLWALGISLAIALLTGLLALRAIRNRQEIVTAGATLLETPPLPAPGPSTSPPIITRPVKPPAAGKTPSPKHK